MRKLLLRLAVLGFVSVAGMSHAAVGTVDMTWDGCTGPVDKTTTTPGYYSLFLTVIGHDQPHIAYYVSFVYGNASQEVPDAWRFDAEGCETSAGITQDVTSKLCPPFSQNGDGVQIRRVRFSPPSDIWATTLMQVLLANSYVRVDSVDPATRYLLERVRFDLTYAVAGASSAATCGGFEQPICFKLSLATWLDPAGNEIYFNHPYPTTMVTFNGPGACSALPARASTWGSIKSQYRE